MAPLRVFVGYDSRMPLVSQVLAHSIERRSSVPVSVMPIALSQLRQVHNRPRHAMQSTEFSFTRFLVPYLAGYQGWALFMDNDMLMLDDVARLFAMRDERYAVMCVQHQHNTQHGTKFLGELQTAYARKNWSSVMLFNCALCTALTPDYVNQASGLELHQFAWTRDEWIGDLPQRWNHLVDVQDALPLDQISVLHYTLGGPYFEATAHCGHAQVWYEECRDLCQVAGAYPLLRALA